MSDGAPPDDRVLVARLKRGDDRAFAELVRRFQGPIYNVVFRLLGHRREEALDVSQEVFVTVFKAIESFRGESQLSTWVHRIAINHCRSRLKYLGRRRDSSHDALDEARSTAPDFALQGEVPGPHASYEGGEAERFIRLALAELDDGQRELVVLRDIEGLAYDEIVTITGLGLGTVKSRLHRAREALEAAYRRFKG